MPSFEIKPFVQPNGRLQFAELVLFLGAGGHPSTDVFFNPVDYSRYFILVEKPDAVVLETRRRLLNKGLMANYSGLVNIHQSRAVTIGKFAII